MFFIIFPTSIILGFFVAISSENNYTSKAVFIPQTSDSKDFKLGKLGGLVSAAGINLEGSAGSEFPPTLYPRILNNVEFQVSLLDSKLIVQGDTLSFRDSFENNFKPYFLALARKYTVGLPGLILKSAKKEELNKEVHSKFPQLSQSESEMIEILLDRTSISPSLREGFVSISVTMHDPLLAAQMTYNLQELLHEELVKYKTESTRAELSYIESSYFERKREFEHAQEQLALFRDRNQNLNTAFALNQLDTFEGDYNLALTIYSELARQREESKLKLSKNTQVFLVIEPIVVPIEKSGPNSMLILISFVLIGFGIFIFRVYLPEWLSNVKLELNRGDNKDTTS